MLPISFFVFTNFFFSSLFYFGLGGEAERFYNPPGKVSPNCAVFRSRSKFAYLLGVLLAPMWNH
eukprot:SAG11_NODE_37016_length_258_cov_12.974843_1_plen_63_part_01